MVFYLKSKVSENLTGSMAFLSQKAKNSVYRIAYNQDDHIVQQEKRIHCIFPRMQRFNLSPEAHVLENLRTRHCMIMYAATMVDKEPQSCAAQ